MKPVGELDAENPHVRFADAFAIFVLAISIMSAAAALLIRSATTGARPAPSLTRIPAS